MNLPNNTAVKGVDYAEQAIAMLRAGNPNARARMTMAMAAVRYGSYTPEARAVWQAYADEGAPR